MLHYTHSEEVGAAIDVQTKSGSSDTTADLASHGLRTNAWKNWSAMKVANELFAKFFPYV